MDAPLQQRTDRPEWLRKISKANPDFTGWAVTPDFTGAEARLLVARVRGGEVDRERLRQRRPIGHAIDRREGGTHINIFYPT